MSDRQERIIMEMEKRRYRRKLLMIPSLLVWFGAFLGMQMLEGRVPWWAVLGTAAALTLGLGWATSRNWRCPACERSITEPNPRFCPQCGVRLSA